MTSHPNRQRIASIVTNDPENDPTPRVRLIRDWIGRRGIYAWHVDDIEGQIVAQGRTAAQADQELRWVYNSPQWDLRFGTFGS